MEQEKTGREMMEEIRNRRLHMNDMLRAVADVVDGYDYDYSRPLEMDRDGSWLEELIAELLASTQKEYEPEKRELYYSFLYCTLLGIKWDWNLCHLSMDYGEYKPAGVLGDVVRMARDTYISTPRRKEDLLYMESVNYADEIRGFFGYMPEVYFLLRGEKVYSLYSEEEKAFVEKGRITLEKKRKETACPTLCEEPDAAEDEKESDALAQAEMGSVVEYAKRHIVRRIRYPEKYIRNYLRFRELSYTGAVKGELAWDREEFIKDIEEMADCYLYRNGCCAYSLEETYGLVTDSIKRLPGIVREAVRRDGEIEKMKKRALEKVMYAGEREELFPKYAAGYIFDLSLKNADGTKCNAALEEFLMDSGFLTASEQAVMRGIANGDGYDEIGVRLHRKAWEIEKIEKRAREKMMYAQDREELFPRGVLG